MQGGPISTASLSSHGLSDISTRIVLLFLRGSYYSFGWRDGIQEDNFLGL